jgi:hypothetical protein
MGLISWGLRETGAKIGVLSNEQIGQIVRWVGKNFRQSCSGCGEGDAQVANRLIGIPVVHPDGRKADPEALLRFALLVCPHCGTTTFLEATTIGLS